MTWTLSNPSGDANAVQAADLLIDGVAATAGAFSGATLSFAAGEASKTVTLALASDAVLEGQALLRMTLSRAGGDTTSSLVTPTAEVQVVDDDEKLSLVPLSSPTVAEGNGGATPVEFKVTREGSSIGAATVTWTLAGSGSHPLDANDIDRIEIDGVAQAPGALSGTLTFADGSLADKSFKVFVKGDTVGEFDEAFTLALSNPGNGTTLGTASATRTVANDDPAVQLVMATPQVAEGNEGDDRAISFQVLRTGDLSQAANVSWSLRPAASGNTVDETDFGGFLPAGLVSFAAGEASKTVTVLTAGDDRWEPDEGFVIELSQPSSGLTIIGSPQVTGTLLNDDMKVEIAAHSATVLESHAGQVANAQFTLSAQGLPTATSALVSWHVEGVGTNPANGDDFVGGVRPSGQTSIGLSNGSGAAVLSIAIAGDNLFGANEQFKVVIDSVTTFSGSTPVGAGSATVPEATVTVLDDDLLIGLSQTENHRHVEGDSGTTQMRFYVDQLAGSTNAAGLADVRVDYHIEGDLDGSDVSGGSATNAALQWDADTHRYYIGVTLNGDTQVEGSERFTLHLDGARTAESNGGVEIAREGASVAGQVLDDDFGIQLVSSNLTQSEDRARFVFDVLRTGATDEAITVKWSVGNLAPSGDGGTSESGVSANDFTDPATGLPYTAHDSAPITGTLTFAAGQTTARFTLEPGHDATPEADERFAVRVEVTELGGQALTAQAHQIDTATALIVNDDPLPPAFDPALDQQAHPPLQALH